MVFISIYNISTFFNHKNALCNFSYSIFFWTTTQLNFLRIDWVFFPNTHWRLGGKKLKTFKKIGVHLFSCCGHHIRNAHLTQYKLMHGGYKSCSIIKRAKVKLSSQSTDVNRICAFAKKKNRITTQAPSATTNYRDYKKHHQKWARARDRGWTICAMCVPYSIEQISAYFAIYDANRSTHRPLSVLCIQQ